MCLATRNTEMKPSWGLKKWARKSDAQLVTWSTRADFSQWCCIGRFHYHMNTQCAIFFPLHYSSDSNRKNKQQKRWKERKKGHDFTLNAPPSNMLVEARTPSCSTNQLQQLKQKQSKKKKKTVTTTITTTRSLRSAKVWGVLKAVIDENSSNTTTTGYFEIM